MRNSLRQRVTKNMRRRRKLFRSDEKFFLLDAPEPPDIKVSEPDLGLFMASTTKKGSRKTKAKPRRPVVKKSQPKQAENIQSLRRERDESLEREAATSDILRMIARAPADLQSVLDTIAERAAKLCDATDASIFRVDGNVLRIAAHFGPIPMACSGEARRYRSWHAPSGRAIIDRQTIHVHDLASSRS